MSLHIEAKPQEIAPFVIITGDPLRAKHSAEKWLSNITCYNRVRGMLGFTGEYKGKKVSIQGTGIGIPSTALYVHELIHDYGVKCIIRLGTCGALQSYLTLNSIIVATEATTDSAAVRHYATEAICYPSSKLLQHVQSVATSSNIHIQSGPIFSTDLFYSEAPNRYAPLMQKEVLGVEMETCMLYAMAAYFNIQAISLLTVSDNLITGELSSPLHREKHVDEMFLLALETFKLHLSNQ